MKRRLLFLLALFLVIGLLGFLQQGLKQDPHLLPSTRIGQAAPPFSLETLDHKHISEKIFLGHFTLLVVWASWCETCQTEQPYLIQLKKNNPSLQLIGLNYKDDTDAARRWLAQYGNPYHFVLQDLQGTIAMDYGVYGTPEIFLIDPQGKILAKHVGVLDETIFSQGFCSLLLKHKINCTSAT